MSFYVSEVLHLKEHDCLFKYETMLWIASGIKVKVNIVCTCSWQALNFIYMFI